MELPKIDSLLLVSLLLVECWNLEGAAQSGVEEPKLSKYPPAKPGALRLGPLKGARFATFDDDVRRSHTRYGTVGHSVEFTSQAVRNPPLCRINGRDCKGRFLSCEGAARAYRRECQTSTATPAKPGDLLWILVSPRPTPCPAGRKQRRVLVRFHEGDALWDSLRDRLTRFSRRASQTSSISSLMRRVPNFAKE